VAAAGPGRTTISAGAALTEFARYLGYSRDAGEVGFHAGANRHTRGCRKDPRRPMTCITRRVAFDRRSVRIGLLVAAVLAALVLTLPITLTPGVRTRLTTALSERFKSDVTMDVLRVSVLPRLRVQGKGVVLRHEGRTDVPPLIEITSFSAEANLLGLLGQPLRLSRVRLEGLEINVPPGGMDIGDDDEDEVDSGKQEDRDSKPRDPRSEAEPASAPTPADSADSRSPLIVDDVISERAVLRILRSQPEKDPRVFEIAHLSMQRAGSNAPWPFSATLTNPTPPGEIGTNGTFGPWNADQPSRTPLAAAYEFRRADLGVFDGIRGILDSTGEFGGVLERIEVTGTTDVPEFALEDVGRPVPLTTRFHAIVDGTNGNTWLQPVDARLGRSPIIAKGGVVERKGEDGRTVTLDVVMKEARIEDVLRLAAVKTANPPMTGALDLKTSLVLPPGEGDAIDKLRLDGSFEIASARFAHGNIQTKVNELSQQARGERDSDAPPERVVSDLSGRFMMRGGVIRFSRLTFSVPGARVNLSGRYTVRSEALDFRGTVRLDAKLSELTGGVKSFLLKLVDPLVRRQNVTEIPVTIGGTAEDPDFGVDIRRAITPG